MLVDINLLPEKEKERSSLLYAALAVLLAALLFWLVFFIVTRSVDQDTERLEQQLLRLELTHSELSDRLNRSETAEYYGQLEASVNWVENYRYETAPLVEDLVAQLPQRGYFQSFGFTAPHQATVEVQFDDKTEAAYYLKRMLSSEVIETASIESIETEDIDTEEGETGNWLPRYIATYTIFFVDPRGMLDGVPPAAPEGEDENASSNTEEDVTEDESNEDNEADEPSAPEKEGSDEESN